MSPERSDQQVGPTQRLGLDAGSAEALKPSRLGPRSSRESELDVVRVLRRVFRSVVVERRGKRTSDHRHRG